jgi:hypothetical protein
MVGIFELPLSPRWFHSAVKLIGLPERGNSIRITQIDDEAVKLVTEAQSKFFRASSTFTSAHQIVVNGLRGDAQLQEEAGFNEFTKPCVDQGGS